MKKKISDRTKLIFLHIFSFVVSAAPLLVYVFCNWGDYAKTTGDTVKITVGLFVVVILFLLKVFGKLKMPSRVVFYGVTCILCYFLYPLIQDIVWLSALCLLGELLDLALFQKPIKTLKEKIIIDKTADATTDKVSAEMRKMFDEYTGGRS